MGQIACTMKSAVAETPSPPPVEVPPVPLLALRAYIVDVQQPPPDLMITALPPDRVPEVHRGPQRRGPATAAVETPSPHPIGVSNLIVTVLPPDPLKMIFKALPASYLFVAPVCRRFRDLYGDARKEKKKHATYQYSIASEAALEAYLEKEKGRYNTRKEATSMIGAGCGRKDWVKRGGIFNEMTCRAAAMGGHLRVLQWLCRRGCPWNERTCLGAASNGHLAVLQWARGEGCTWNRWMCNSAASNGHLEVLRWARGEGCEWDGSTCAAAALGGHLEVLRWAIDNGCPYKKRRLSRISDPGFHKWFGEYQAKNSNQV